ncbi:MAG: histidine phosphatase family protein [Ignavibacteriae bacterium]|nr:histidine phosphatase family protein [Ignavibacteriota bacterium]
MKTLLLVRHAKSSWKNPELSDRERPLNNRGKRDAPFMGKLLSERGVKPDLLITSPTNRAMTTARYVAHELQYRISEIVTDESLYGQTMDHILHVIQGFENSINTVMIIGHNPEITLCANYITANTIENIPTCGIVCVDFSIELWNEIARGNGALRYFEYPKKYFK